ncbi:MAG: hypothetical protein ACK4P2_04400 [Hyphomonas sp.]
MQRDLVFPEAVALAPPVQKPELKAPWHLFLIGAAAVLWNVLGVFDFLATLTRFPPYIDRLPEGARVNWTTLPPLVFGIWALAVFSAVTGSVLLLKRQLLAVRVLALSTTATIFTMAFSYSRPGIDYDSDRVFAVCIIVVSLLILNYALDQAKRGILR